MGSYFLLGMVALLPVIAAIIINKMDEKGKFDHMTYPMKQLTIGFIFGCLAILGTEWGVPINGAQINCRDAAVLTAGLMFGGPAGIIAGCMGALERWIAVFWGVGTYTRVACTVATFIAGFYGAFLRKYMFEGKRPWWLIALGVGCVMEIFHVTMVFLTHMDEPYQALAVVSSCTVPLVLANSVSIALCSLAMAHIAGERVYFKRGTRTVTEIMQRWLIVIVMIAFALTSTFVFSVQNSMAGDQAKQQLANTIEIARAEMDADLEMDEICNNIKAGEEGFVYVLNSAGEAIGKPYGGKYTGGFTTDEKESGDVFEMEYADQTYLAMYEEKDGKIILTGIPKANALKFRDFALYVNTFMEILAFGLLFAFLFFAIKRVVVNGLRGVNKSLNKITEGDLNEIVNVDSSQELKGLSDDINTTVSTLKKYIKDAEEKIDQELQFAKDIQYSSLPAISARLKARKDMSIFASMDTAKEVGGDFYDFYFTGPDRFNFLIADVSGKGVPAAMFMMRAKTELRATTENADKPAQVFEAANNALCDGNDAGMFVTAWQGRINLVTGKLSFANAGHNPPLLRKNGELFEYVEQKKGFILAGMEEMPYKPQVFYMDPGDTLFLYTDGVTEATRENGELYGEARLRGALNEAGDVPLDELCQYIREDIDAFVDGAAQFDDITMLAFKYEGKPPVMKIEFENATIEDITAITDFVEEELAKIGLSRKQIIHVNIAIDEIFSNIVKYAYGDETGPATVEITEIEDPHRVEISFIDQGIPHNPLVKEAPDITLSAEDRQIGGLGIFITKEIMDDMKYRYENDMNILSIYKNLD